MSKKKDSTSSDKNRASYNLSAEMREKLCDLPDILEFIENLLQYVGKYKKKVKILKSKIQESKDNLKKVDVFVQTTEEVNSADLQDKMKNTVTEPVESITEDITKAAEQAIQNSGFVYEETSGMYYDYATGYYYNAEYGLYYDGNTGTYLQYNQDTKQYVYHSQVYTDTLDTQELNVKRKGKNKTKTKVKTSDLDHLTNSLNNMTIDSLQKLASDATKRWPPCMRIIVEESSVPNLKKGSLHIITYEGGSIGREGSHSLLIPDINISKHHLNISYNNESNVFQAVDMGSRNGTILNGTRMSISKQESGHFDVVHGSRIQLGSSILLCHVHEGSQTCGHCEPGLLKQNESEPIKKMTKVVKKECHRKELQNLKKKFGMNNFQADNNTLASGYTDRAQKRREVIGSHNEHEKTQAASLDESISSKNKGFQLLSKMGWKEGQSLGKEGQGILEPIKLVSNEGTSGVGSSKPQGIEVTKEQKKRKIIWTKTQERFDKLPDASDIFEESE